MTLGQRIFQKRKELDLSQESLGEKLNVSRQTVYKWENNQATPELEKIITLAEIFQVTTGWLINEEKITEEQGQNPDIENNHIKQIKGNNQSMMMVLLGLIIIIMVVFGFRFSALEKKYESLQSSLNNYYANTQNQIMHITDNIQTTLNNYSNITLDADIKIDHYDFENNLIFLNLSAKPKKYSDGMKAISY